MALKAIGAGVVAVTLAVASAASEPPVAPREAAMSGTLVLTILKVKSSYLQGREERALARDVPDTIQWWIGRDQIWRLTTFAIDHDVHVSAFGAATSDPVAFARTNNRSNYGDIIRVEHVLKFADCTDAGAVARVLKAASLANRLQVETGRFAYWKPDDAEYRVVSKPTIPGKVEN